MSPVVYYYTIIFLRYNDLLKRVCQIANVLKRHGVQKGTRVIIHLPTHPMAISCMLACARIGAIHW